MNLYSKIHKYFISSIINQLLIRINPDKYKEDGKTIKSCFTFSKTNTIKATTKNFNKRFNLLVEMIKYYIDNEPKKEITFEKLFFT